MTHNLHIIVKSNENETYILEKVYEKIADVSIYKNILWRGQQVESFVYWKKEIINDIEQNFMGDLFTTTIHSDALLYHLTKKIINEIENDIKTIGEFTDFEIIWHISKLLEI